MESNAPIKKVRRISRVSKKKIPKSNSQNVVILFEQDVQRATELQSLLHNEHFTVFSENTIGTVNLRKQEHPYAFIALNISHLIKDEFQIVSSNHGSNNNFIFYSNLPISAEEKRLAKGYGEISIINIEDSLHPLLSEIQQRLDKNSGIRFIENSGEVPKLHKQLQRLLNENQLLHISGLRYKSYFENASFPIFVLDPKKDIVLEMNEQAEKFLGYTKVELKKMKTLPFVSPSTQLRDIVNWGIQLTNTATMKAKNGELVDVELTAGIEEQASQNGEYSSSLILYVKDITEQKRLRKQLVQAEKLSLLGRLSAGIAHEIRNPLTAVKINLQEFDLQTPKEHSLRESLSLALEGVSQIEQIIESTLEFARPTKPDRKSSDINDILHKSISFAKTQFQKKKINLVVKSVSQLPFIEVDPMQIQQVFLNLITNAIDASYINGKIEVNTFKKKNFIPKPIQSNAMIERENFLSPEKGDYVVVEFKDFGMGISKEQVEHLFEPFYTSKAKGTGLGLAISQQILELHNAFISVISEKEIGTSFLCYFPITKNHKQ